MFMTIIIITIIILMTIITIYISSRGIDLCAANQVSRIINTKQTKLSEERQFFRALFMDNTYYTHQAKNEFALLP